MTRKKIFIVYSMIFILGLIVGGYLFHAALPRSFLTFNNCHRTCLQERELLGLLASIGIKHVPGAMPGIIKETDKTIAIKHPFPEAKIHYVVIPKKDIKDIASVSNEDGDYIVDATAVMGDIVREQHLKLYKIITHGQLYQHVSYLHFHLLSKD